MKSQTGSGKPARSGDHQRYFRIVTARWTFS